MSNVDPDLKPTERNRPIAIDVVEGNLIVKRHSGREESFPLASGGGVIDSTQVVVQSHGSESYNPNPNQPLIVPNDIPTTVDWMSYHAEAGYVQLSAIEARSPITVPELGGDYILLAEGVYLDPSESPFETIYIVGVGAYQVSWNSVWEQSALGRRGMNLNGTVDSWFRDEHPEDAAGFPIYKQMTLWLTPTFNTAGISLAVEQTSGADLGMRSAQVTIMKVL